MSASDRQRSAPQQSAASQRQQQQHDDYSSDSDSDSDHHGDDGAKAPRQEQRPGTKGGAGAAKMSSSGSDRASPSSSSSSAPARTIQSAGHAAAPRANGDGKSNSNSNNNNRNNKNNHGSNDDDDDGSDSDSGSFDSDDDDGSDDDDDDDGDDFADGGAPGGDGQNLGMLTEFIRYTSLFLRSVAGAFDDCEKLAAKIEMFNNVMVPYKPTQEMFCKEYHKQMSPYYATCDAKDATPLINADIGVLRDIEFKEKWLELTDAEFYTAREIDNNTRRLWPLLRSMNKYARLYNDIPTAIVGKIESKATAIAKNFINGTTSWANLDIMSIGQSVIQDASQADIKDLMTNMSNIYETIGGMDGVAQQTNRASRRSGGGGGGGGGGRRRRNGGGAGGRNGGGGGVNIGGLGALTSMLGGGGGGGNTASGPASSSSSSSSSTSASQAPAGRGGWKPRQR